MNIGANWSNQNRKGEYMAFETVGQFKCPKCGHMENADASPHLYFETNQWALRCRKCKHTWKAEPGTRLKQDLKYEWIAE